MKRINQKDCDRLEALAMKLFDEFRDRARQTTTIGRGDARAIWWAASWIRDTIAEDLKLRRSA